MVYIWIYRYMYISLYMNVEGFGCMDGFYMDVWINLMGWMDRFRWIGGWI